MPDTNTRHNRFISRIIFKIPYKFKHVFAIFTEVVNIHAVLKKSSNIRLAISSDKSILHYIDSIIYSENTESMHNFFATVWSSIKMSKTN